jgi:hypothetical protein
MSVLEAIGISVSTQRKTPSASDRYPGSWVQKVFYASALLLPSPKHFRVALRSSFPLTVAGPRRIRTGFPSKHPFGYPKPLFEFDGEQNYLNERVIVKFLECTCLGLEHASYLEPSTRITGCLSPSC